jgi:methionine-rich copper-binding protein CopC
MARIRTYSLFLTTVSVAILSAPHLAYGQVIHEIMFDLAEGTDSGREWIEILNTASSSIDLTTYKILENGTNHGIKAVGDATVPVGAHAVVADNPQKFKDDHPEYAGLLFDSAFSLSNDGEKIVLKDSRLTTVDSASYTGKKAGGDGNSLQKVNGTFVAGIPTPGALNTSEAVPPKPVAAKVIKPKATKAKSASAKAAKGRVIASTEDDVVPDTALSETDIQDQVAAAARAVPAPESTSTVPWMVGSAALALFGAGAVAVSRRMTPSTPSASAMPHVTEPDPADDFEIKDISDDDEFEQR